MKRRGFTIVELLIVIVVIAILATITIVAYNGVQQRARATAVWTAISQVNKSFHLYLTDEAAAAWPLDTEFVASAPLGNPTLQQIIDGTSFKNFMQHVPSQGTNWFYDNDGDTYPSGGITGGANICFDGIDPDLAAAVDRSFDNNDLGSGALRYNLTSDRMYFTLSKVQGFN